jgi:23S rRNA (adenine2503-C2)-methyltransferase
MTNLSKELRADLTSRATPAALTLGHLSESRKSPGTRKAVFRLYDGETVESVLIREEDRRTICISSQVGCAVKCTFCATGLSGYTRNLSPGEIAEQAARMAAMDNLEGRTPNIVFMGMGEPFRNLDNVVASIRLLTCKDGLGIGARKITVSTAGEVPGIYAFAEMPWQVRLSVSLHAANDTLRSELVPLNRKYPLAKLLAGIDYYLQRVGRQITFEWALLKGVNDRKQDAEELARVALPRRAFVNVIPYNPVEGVPYSAPDRQASMAFRDHLISRGVQVTLRKEQGQDIDAACGQLRRRVEEDGPKATDHTIPLKTG